MEIIRRHFDVIGSTNTWAKENAESFDPAALTLVTATEQTGGRGRFKRKWHSPPGVNVYASFCFFLDGTRLDIGHVPQLLALSTAYSLEALGFQPLLKWPNDILLSGKKVGGILCETTAGENGRWVISGIGLNVNMSQPDIDQIDRPATSLMVEGGCTLDVETVLKLVGTQFNRNLALFLQEDFRPFFPDYEMRSCFKKGGQIRFHDNQNSIEGLFYALNSDGSVTIELEESGLKTFYSGEFF
jgi:BirA family biotin operon repressor/biotin-[acetyl-CoA-carboxylase] ligase